MKASKTLGKPENWQDFETLCKKLWGEIWQCPEIKKNGRSGQDQSGVDIYGIPSGENEYYGIQCKGKDEYTHKQLTLKEINTELARAKNFTPKLKKFYFATTANKDAKIGAIIREKNIEYKNSGLFEVHLFSWEDIVDLINENENTYNYYVKSINFQTQKNVSVTFQNNKNEITISPKFKQLIVHYNEKGSPANPYTNPILNKLYKQQKLLNKHKLVVEPASKTEINHSYCELSLKIHNTGNSALENYKIFLEFEGAVKDIAYTNENYTGFAIVSKINHDKPTVYLSSSDLSAEIVPKKNILVGDDIFVSDKIFVKPPIDDSQIIIKWKLISKDFKNSGELIINSIPEIKKEYKTVYVDDPSKSGFEKQQIEDYIGEMTDDK